MLQTKGTQAFGKRHTKSHTLCVRCGNRSFHKQKKTCAQCGYPAAKIRKCGISPERWDGDEFWLTLSMASSQLVHQGQAPEDDRNRPDPAYAQLAEEVQERIQGGCVESLDGSVPALWLTCSLFPGTAAKPRAAPASA